MGRTRQLPKSIVGKTEDGRPIFGFEIDGVKYQAREPNVEEIIRVELESLRQYAGFMRENPDQPPEGYQIDARLTNTLATIISPKLAMNDLRKMPSHKWRALQTALVL